ncbi:MAG TPA: CotH kinase family protein, partial [Verrucomicrobiae bacterium]|nr:CotH kinase family protein [Verrucomicrobiae bacterium]
MRSFVHRAIQLISLAATVWVVGSANPSVFAAEILPYGTNWRYIIGLSEASSPDPAAWRQLGFDDSAWTAAPAPIGYANPPNSPAEFTIATLVPSSQEGNYSSVFVRTAFVAKNPTPGNVFTVNVNIDDGCIVWINGTEVGRFNVPAGDLAYNQWAVSAGEPAIASFSATNSAQGPVVSGTNILAVQVFNANATSSDLFFDLSLESDLDEVPPAVESADPPAGSTVTDFTEIDVSFTENVTGVDASDLLINGAPATGVSVISPKEYVFSFPAPPLGNVTVSWASNHGITDLASNSFAGVGWNYLLHPADTRGAVIISEFLADNEHGIKDEDGQHSDWIELLNTGTTIANLDGWFLTDETNLLAKWRFPAITLAPNGYLVVFASGKDRTNATAPLHTNFKISKTGGFLALVDSNTNVVSSFNPYPAQQSDISYGRDAVTTSLTGYLGTPTPGAPNGVSGLGFAPTATLSVKGGVYTNNSLSVTMTAPAGQIRYTLDGSVPSTTSTLYAGPITITTSVTLKGRAFQAGLLPGPVAAESYIMVDSTVAKFTSNLPLMILSTSGKGVADHPAQGQPGTFASMVEVQPVRGQSTPFAGVDYLGGCEINIRGQTSAGFPKKPYRLSTQDAYRNSLNAGLLGMPPDDDWILNNPYTDKPFLQNFMAYELYERMGHYSVRRRFVEVFVNTSGGKISYPRDYAGLYILLEKIKVAEDRVNLDKLTPYDTKEPEISGGYMFKKDKDTA